MLEGIKPSVARAGVREATKHQHNEANNSKSTTTAIKKILTCHLPDVRQLIHHAKDVVVDDVLEPTLILGGIVAHLLSCASTSRSNFGA